jgi:hypothetical protein
MCVTGSAVFTHTSAPLSGESLPTRQPTATVT